MNILILGVGNLLLSDEAVGVRIVEGLGREYRFAPGIELLDGGTAGMELLEAMASRDHIILVDAVRSGNPPGTVVTLKDEEIPTLFGRKISPHQLGLADVLSALHMTGGVAQAAHPDRGRARIPRAPHRPHPRGGCCHGGGDGSDFDPAGCRWRARDCAL